MGHRGGPLLAGRERLQRLAHLGSLEVADLGREAVERRAGAGQRGQQVGVPVARDHLGGDRLALQAEPSQGVLLDPRVGVGVRADGARKLAHLDSGEGVAQAQLLTAQLGHEAEQHEPERGRLGVDAVGAADHRRVTELLGPVQQRPFGTGQTRSRGTRPANIGISASL